MHTKFRHLISALLVSQFSLASAAEQPLPNPILNPDTPWVFAGFSVNVPADEGWVSFFRSGTTAAFGKNPDDTNHIYGVNVLAAPLSEAIKSSEDLVSQLNKSRPILVDMEEFSIIEHRESPATVNGYWCSRYTFKADTKKKQDLGHLFIQGLSCANPSNPKQMVDVGVSDLTGSDSMAGELQPLVDRILQSIRFLPRITKKHTEEIGKAIAANDVTGAVQSLEKHAQDGDSRAAYLLGDIYLNAKDAIDYEKARKWLEKSASIGERDALYQMGVVYDKALGVERNLEQAVKWFKLAADQRDAQAQLNLGILHDPRANGIAKDPEMAAQWFVMSANNGNQRAKQILEKQYVRKSAPSQPEKQP